jgi:hypothetical protein
MQAKALISENTVTTFSSQISTQSENEGAILIKHIERIINK